MQHIVLLAFVVVNEYKVKAKKQRAALTLQTKSTGQKIILQSYINIMRHYRHCKGTPGQEEAFVVQAYNVTLC